MKRQKTAWLWIVLHCICLCWHGMVESNQWLKLQNHIPGLHYAVVAVLVQGIPGKSCCLPLGVASATVFGAVLWLEQWAGTFSRKMSGLIFFFFNSDWFTSCCGIRLLGAAEGESCWGFLVGGFFGFWFLFFGFLFVFFFFEAFKPLIKGADLAHEKASAAHALFLVLLPSYLILGKIGFGSDPEWLLLWSSVAKAKLVPERN